MGDGMSVKVDISDVCSIRYGSMSGNDVDDVGGADIDVRVLGKNVTIDAERDILGVKLLVLILIVDTIKMIIKMMIIKKMMNDKKIMTISLQIMMNMRFLMK